MVAKSADAFRTISEVAEWLGVQTHVLRFWESKFSQVKPVKRAGGRRYYRPADMLLLGGIRKLLHEDGMTIKGVQKILREEGMAHVADMSPPLDDITAAQVDGDLVAGDGAIEAELVPPTPEPEIEVAPEPVVEEAAIVAPVVEAATPEPVIEEPQGPPVIDEPVLETPEAPTPEPMNLFAEPPAPDVDDAAPVDETPDTAALPPEPDAAEPARDTPAPLPAFLRRPTPPEPATEAPEDAPETAAVPSFMAAPPQAEPAPEAEAPKPQIIDVPEEPNPEALEVRPSALGLAARAGALTEAQRAAIAPLVAELTALRDRMASARRDSR